MALKCRQFLLCRAELAAASRERVEWSCLAEVDLSVVCRKCQHAVLGSCWQSCLLFQKGSG